MTFVKAGVGVELAACDAPLAAAPAPRPREVDTCPAPRPRPLPRPLLFARSVPPLSDPRVDPRPRPAVLASPALWPRPANGLNGLAILSSLGLHSDQFVLENSSETEERAVGDVQRGGVNKGDSR